MAAVVALAFLGGLLAGSFVTVVAHRVPRGESIVGPRSRCPACGAQIAAYDNVPVFSWLLLRGRSRCCGDPISARYPLTELALGVLYAATVAVFWGNATELVLGLVRQHDLLEAGEDLPRLLRALELGRFVLGDRCGGLFLVCRHGPRVTLRSAGGARRACAGRSPVRCA